MKRILIIDDDAIHHRVAQILLSRHDSNNEIMSFIEASKALSYIKENYNVSDALPDFILLDLNMPLIDGWCFLDAFNKFQNQLIKQAQIFIVSSSVDKIDIARSKSYSSIKGFIPKPLSLDVLRLMLKGNDNNP